MSGDKTKPNAAQVYTDVNSACTYVIQQTTFGLRTAPQHSADENLDLARRLEDSGAKLRTLVPPKAKLANEDEILARTRGLLGRVYELFGPTKDAIRPIYETKTPYTKIDVGHVSKLYIKMPTHGKNSHNIIGITIALDTAFGEEAYTLMYEKIERYTLYGARSDKLQIEPPEDESTFLSLPDFFHRLIDGHSQPELRDIIIEHFVNLPDTLTPLLNDLERKRDLRRKGVERGR